MIDDIYILNKFIDKNGNVSGPKLKTMTEEDEYYLINRFSDISIETSYQEIIYRILNNIEETPKCPICGKPRLYKHVKHYLPTCGSKACIYENMQHTFENRYNGRSGFGNSNSSSKIKKTMQDIYGVENPAQSKDIWESTNISKHSKEEDLIYEALSEIFPSIIRNYKSDLYPYFADFYIPEKDLYIEYHGSMFHNGHRYDTITDKALYKSIKAKCGKDKPNRYDSVLYTWTILDVQKLKIATENKLNYLVIYPCFIDKNRNKARHSKMDPEIIKNILTPFIYNYKNITIIGENI